jgi:hypothetical protein
MRAAGAAHYQRVCSADPRDHSAAALELRRRPRAVARKEEVGRRFAVWFSGGTLEAAVAAMELLQLG